jgi:HKD family nuclease
MAHRTSESAQVATKASNHESPSMRLLIHQYDSELRSLAERAVEIRILIAFMTEPGLSWLPKEKIPVIECIVGTGLGITTPGAIRTLMTGGGDVWVFQDPSRLFHPKALYFRTPESEYLVVGSNNLTSSGISSNYELSTLSTKTESNASAFEDFLVHFENLKRDAACRRPNQQFFDDYKPRPILEELKRKLAKQQIVPIPVEIPEVDPSLLRRNESVGELLRTIAKQFPNVKEATRKGTSIAEHPLKKLNEDQFINQLQDIVQRASSSRLAASSSLNQGGNWRRTPLISASDDSREPWARTSRDGRLVLQLHFGDDFKNLSVSLVLQYTTLPTEKTGSMPDAVHNRFKRLIDRLNGFADEARVDGPPFKLFDYKQENVSAWARPILSYSHAIGSLPSDAGIERNIESLAAALNEGAFVS